jgi:TonB family protein
MSGLLIGQVNAIPPQKKPEKQDADRSDLAKRCNPTLVKSGSPKGKSIQVRDGEKSSGFTPIISFEILETGKVNNARVKRSSGIRDIDYYALASIRSQRYNSRPGCPVIETDADVMIDFQ